MKKSDHFELSVEDMSDDGVYGHQKVSSPGKYITAKRLAIAVVVIALCILGLGLGLGLGLKDGDIPGGVTSDPPPVTGLGCVEFKPPRGARNGQTVRSARSKRWTSQSDSKPVSGQAVCPTGFDEPPLLVISMDGFRAEYLTRGFTPTLQKLSEGGVHAPYMRPAYITKTFPNHYTIMTGLYPESHGIIDNIMYDMEWKEQFTLSSQTSDDGKWWQGEPMWLTSKRQGKKSASIFWPGSEANITGEYPDYCFHYDQSSDFYDIVDQVFAWLDLDKGQRPSFISMYFYQPDTIGHQYGPFADQVNSELAYLDEVMAYLMDGISDRSLQQCLNMMIVADHGMGELYCGEKTVYLEDYLDVSQYYIYDGVYGRITSKYVDNGQGEIVEVDNPESAADTLSRLACSYYNNTKDWNVKFYLKEDLPKRLHYASHKRIDDIIMDIEDKWQAVESRSPRCQSGASGAHGYDNTYKSMNALFMAFGPAFKQNLKIKPFENIELYNLMAEILEVTPADNNGTQGRLHHVLSNPQPLQAPLPAASDYIDCPFPDDDTADMTRNMTDCQCDDLQNITNKTIEELDQQLNLTEWEVNVALSTHLPYGVPQIHMPHMKVCVLPHTDYVSGYSHTHHMPLWTAFTLHRLPGVSVIDSGNYRSDKTVSDCVRSDVRVDNTTDCSSYGDPARDISPAFLYPPGFSNSTEEQLDGHLTSNSVPMYDAFREGVWQQLLYLIEEYADKYGKVSVTMGPLFDYNNDGLVDPVVTIPQFVENGSVPVPSHYYVTVSQCEMSDCLESTELCSIVLVHKPTLSNCWDRKIFHYLQDNVVRVRDIELLTGFTFFTGVLNLTERVLLRTHLQIGLLPRMSWMDLGEDAIPDTTQCPTGYNSDNPPVLVISIDGFRNDYVHRNKTPTLTRLRELGVKTDHMLSVYPTMTFPNHYTQVTGLYPESHGIVDNNMYDQDLEERFYLGSDTSLDPAWWLGEPIWNTVELQNKTAMTMFWPGSEVQIQGIRPTEYFPYNDDYPYELRVDTVLEWLNGSAGVTPDLVTLYFSSVDSAGHETGPLSIEVEEVMQVVDGNIKDLMDGLYRQKLHKCVNIIIISDHGMSTISCENTVLTREHLSQSTMRSSYMFYGTSSRISNQYYYKSRSAGITAIPPESRVNRDEIVANLSCASSGMSVFTEEDLPRRLHYLASSRIDPIVLKLNDTWQANRYTAWCGIEGQHGWDPSYESMKAFFLAFGPSFASEKELAPFQNIELYNLFSILANVTPAPNNGTKGALYSALKHPPDLPTLDGGVEYSKCPYPVDLVNYTVRANLTTAGCVCDSQDIESDDEQLNMTSWEQSALQTYHLPFGVPFLDQHTACLLHHQHYISAYSSTLLMPVYTAFYLNKYQVENRLGAGVVPDCLRPDVRLSQNKQPLCKDYDSETLHTSFLFPPEFSNATEVFESLLTTNTVPMYDTFRTGVWQKLMMLIQQWTIQLESLHVIVGPLFDYEADGLVDDNITEFMNGTDIALPSHYFAVVLHCSETNCEQMQYTVKSFIIPHSHNVTNCMSVEDYLTDNLSRLRDVELISGLQLLTMNNTQESINTRLYTPGDLIWN